MSEGTVTEAAPKTRKWRRRLLRLFTAIMVLLLSLAVLFFSLPLWAKPLIASIASGQLGLPVEIATLSVSMGYSPTITLQKVSIGEGALHATVRECIIHTNLLEPVMQKSFVALVEATGVDVYVGEDWGESSAALSELLGNFERTDSISDGGVARPETPGFDVHLDLDDIKVHRGEALAATGYLSLVNLLSATMQVTWYFDAPILRPDTQLSGSIRMRSASDGGGISGNFSLLEFHINDLLAQLEQSANMVGELPDVVINAAGALEGNPAQQVSLTLQGKLNATDEPMIAGDFGGTLWFDAEKLTLNDFVWTLPGVEFAADGNYNFDGQMAAQIGKARIEGDPLSVLLAFVPAGPFRLAAGKGAYLEVEDALGGVDEQGNLRFSKGGLAFAHILAKTEDGGAGLGDFEGALNVSENTLHVEKILGRGFRAAGKIQPDMDTGNAQLAFAGEVDLGVLLGASVGAEFPLSNASGKLQLQELTGSYSMNDGLGDDLRARLILENVGGTYTLPGGEPLRLKSVNGAMEYQDGALKVSEIKGEGLRLAGEVRPDFENSRARLDMNGSLDLSSGLLRMFLPEIVASMSGELLIDKLTGTFGSEGGVPSDLQVNAALRNGGASLRGEAYTEKFSGIESSISTDGKRVNLEAKAVGERAGNVAISGAHDLAQGVFSGKVQCSPNTLVQPYLAGQAYPILVASLMNAYSPATLDIRAEMPGENRKTLALSVSRPASPTAALSANFSSTAEGYVLGDLSFSADCPLAQVDFRELPYPISASGTASMRMEGKSGSGVFSGEINLVDAALESPPYFNKAQGQAMRVVMQGATQPSFGLDEVDIELLGERIRLGWTEQGIAARQLALNLAALAPCFPTAQSMSGVIEGSFQSAPMDLNLKLRQVKAILGVPLPINEIDGELQYRANALECRNLRVLGAGNDFTADALIMEGNLSGSIRGGSIDLDSFMALYTQFTGGQGSDNQNATPEGGQGGGLYPQQGTANVDITRVLYFGEEFKQVRADISISEQELRVDNLYVVPRSGSVAGTLKIAYPSTPSRRYLETDLTLNEADMQVLDAWYSTEPRGVYGSASGTVKMTIPFSDTGVVYNGLNGTMNLLMKDGSFGKMGFATKMTTAMRSTEIIQLRAPQMKDKGLTFEMSTLNLKATNGMVEIDPFDMISPSYEIKATGVLNYPQDSTNIVATFGALERVSGIAQGIPVLGEALGVVSGVADLTIYITGSPNNPQYRIGSRVVEGPAPSEPESGTRRPGEALRERATNFLDRIGR